MVQFVVGETYDCGSFNGNENIFRIESRTEETVTLTAIYHAGEELKECGFGTHRIETIDGIECVMIEQDFFDEDCKEYICASMPFSGFDD